MHDLHGHAIDRLQLARVLDAGEVVGIVVAGIENNSACYAVPIEAAEKIRSDFVRFGEVRDGAAYDLLQALNTGHAGSISTLHASSATHALNRLARLALQADTGLPFASIQSEIGDAIQYVAHMERRGPRRQIIELIRITGFHSESGSWQLVPISGVKVCE